MDNQKRSLLADLVASASLENGCISTGVENPVISEVQGYERMLMRLMACWRAFDQLNERKRRDVGHIVEEALDLFQEITIMIWKLHAAWDPNGVVSKDVFKWELERLGLVPTGFFSDQGRLRSPHTGRLRPSWRDL
ncbi:hypothetical protein N8I71_17785 [Roseibacterium sp. SDUM158016]|uniref:hypothetical protein n=1 Tax=Roseicyclus sediminis TaxID=2980997 RepID=UPI0021CEC299|nr:hypothetical protein [Roseibacterium sp. SDUM158016]MCU4654694.1 hypothetical protein [Roseibacterium sp. SDUM158016]